MEADTTTVKCFKPFFKTAVVMTNNPGAGGTYISADPEVVCFATKSPLYDKYLQQ